MATPDGPRENVGTQVFSDSKFGAESVERLHTAFELSRNPMLIADDRRRWVTANTAACGLLGIAREEVPWHTMDEFTPPSARKWLEEQWEGFLANGAAEGLYQLDIPQRGPVPVEFSATANVLPSRHLSVFIPPDELSTEQVRRALDHNEPWSLVADDTSGDAQLTDREREIMTMVASGLQGGDMAERLFLSPETIKSHVHNAMAKLGARTRAHAVAIALVQGQISWEM